MFDGLRSLMEESYNNSKAHGFWEGKDPQDPSVLTEKLMLMVEELTEAFGELRKGLDPMLVYYSKENPGKPEGFLIEMTDLQIRLADLMQAMGADFPALITRKHEYNKTRPYKHGKVC